MSQHFNAYMHLIHSEMEPYLNLAYRTDRVDSDWHKENVIQLVFDYDESATDPRKKFHLAQWSELRMKDMPGEGDRAQYTHEALLALPGLHIRGAGQGRAHCWLANICRMPRRNHDGEFNMVATNSPIRLLQAELGPFTRPYPRSTRWFPPLVAALEGPQKTRDEQLEAYFAWLEKDDPEWDRALNIHSALRNQTRMAETSAELKAKGEAILDRFYASRAAPY